MNSTSSRLIGVSVAICLLSGCAVDSGGNIGSAIEQTLTAHEGRPTAAVDLDAIVPGAWSRLLVVCRGASRVQVIDSLGFEWPEAPDPSASGFLAELLFVTEDRVEHRYIAGQEEFNEQPYFTPCETMEPGRGGPSNVILLKRDDSILEFQWMGNSAGRPSNYWYIDWSKHVD